MNSNQTNIKNPLVSIGLPVFNGEIFLKKALDTLLSQSYSNFELIISDNASEDSTAEICSSYAKKDKRISYIRQSENIGAFENFKFVLDNAKGEYFFWAAADDYWKPEFIMKNLDVLINNENVVCSISKIDTYGFSQNELEKYQIPTVNYPKFLQNYIMKRRKKMICTAYSISGTFPEKIRKFLKNPGSSSRFYGLYRTEQIKSCLIKKPFIGAEFALSLNLLRLGDFYEVDQILFHRFDSGWSTYGIINMAKKTNSGFLGIIFPFYPFNSWCLKNIGLKNILRNFDIFARMNVDGTFFVCIDILMKIKQFITNNFI